MKIVGYVIPLDFFKFNAKKRYINEKQLEEINKNIKTICQKIKIDIEILDEKPQTSLFLHLHKKAEKKGYDGIAIIAQCSEFYSQEQNQKLLKHFVQYKADIGFADNFPGGMLFTFIRSEILTMLENIRQSKKIEESLDFIEKIIEVDVNTFDLENLYAPVGLQALRLDFRLDNQHNYLLSQQLKKIMLTEKPSFSILDWEFEDFAKLILQNKASLKSVPKYYQWHLSSQEAQDRIISPYSLMDKKETEKKPISLSQFKEALKKILCTTDDPIIGFCAAITEPTLHPQWKEIVQHCLEQKVYIILETSGANLSSQDIEQLIKWPNQEFFTIIFLIEAIDEKIYNTFRQGDPSSKNLLKIVEECLLKKPDKTYIETIKTKENINHLFDFYKNFQKFTEKIIINKYNTFRNALEERRARPMEPLNRIDCWHLKRDMVIDWVGDVWMCKQDFKKEYILGNIVQDQIKTILQKNDMIFKKHLCGLDFCKNCDEYYTFNF